MRMAKNPSQIQILRDEFKAFKTDVIVILEDIVDYFWTKDVLGMERSKSEKIKALIKSLKKGE